MLLATCAQAHFVYVLALHCYKLLQKEVNKRLHNVCYALYYTHTNNAPKETQRANHTALRSDRAGSSGNHHHRTKGEVTMITKNQAMTKRYFSHVTLKDSRGNPVRCRASGKCQTWKTRPNDFKLPVKYGLYQCFYITPENAAEWSAD